MTRPELRKAVEYMDEEQIIELYCLYDQIKDTRTDENEGAYDLKMEILDTELAKTSRPKVDAKLAKKIGFWRHV